MIGRMTFVGIMGPLSVFDRAVDTIQSTALVHIQEVPLAESPGQESLQRANLSDVQARGRAAYEELVQRFDEGVVAHIPTAMRNRIGNSPAFTEQCEYWCQQSDASIALEGRALMVEVRSFLRRRRNLDDDLRVMTAYEEVLEAMAPLVASHGLSPAFEFMGVMFERKNAEAEALLEEKVRKLTVGECDFFHGTLKGGRVAALIGFHKQYASEVRDFIAEIGINEIRGPGYLRGKPFREVLTTLKDDLVKLRQQKDILAERIDAFFLKKGAALLALQEVGRARFARLDVVTSFARTHYTFIIEGWVPSDELDKLCQSLRDSCGESVVVRQLRATDKEGPPVVLKNPKLFQPFESLLGLLPLPKYGTIDPTMSVATFFPPIFGLMLGDIGYGVILGLGAFLLYRFARGRELQRALAAVLAFCAFFTVLFGFVFGEMFGSAGHYLGLKPIWQERFSLEGENKGESLLAYLFLTVAVGATHILCGLILGIINGRRSGDNDQVFDCFSRIAGLLAVFLVVGVLTGVLPAAATSACVVAVGVFVVMAAYKTIKNPIHGMMLPLEILSTVGNILSYARIMAVGIVSVILALLANDFASRMDNFVFAAIILVLIHSLNLALGIIDPTIQGLRLHYVEFFSKFYETGGRPYSPFAGAVREGRTR